MIDAFWKINLKIVQGQAQPIDLIFEHLPVRKPFHGNSRSYTLQTLPQAFPPQLSQPHAPAICF